MRNSIDHLLRLTGDRLRHWVVVLVCVPSLIAIPTPGMTLRWGAASQQSCTQRPGDVCRCPAWRKAAGVCCCSKALVRSSPKQRPGCCAVPNGAPTTGQSRVASCCHPGAPKVSADAHSRSLARKSTRGAPPEWSACPCGDRTGSSLSLVAQPRIVPPIVCVAGMVRSGFAHELSAINAESWPSRPATPPPRIRLLST
jgi:hypothetical protein